MKRKGAIHIDFVIAMIILLLSAGVILFFYWQFYWKGTINRETCHESVLLRHIFNIGQTLELGRESVPLRCKTQKVCLYLNEKDDCGFPVDDIEYKKIKGKDDEETLENIKIELANSLYEAWSTMGEGRLQLFHRGKTWKEIFDNILTGEDYSHRCVIFSRIGFSLDLKEKFPKISGLNEYLDRGIPNQEISYWDKLAGVDHAEGNLEVFDMRKYENLKGYLNEIETKDKQMILFMELDRVSVNLPFTNVRFIGLQDAVDFVEKEMEQETERHFISGVFLRRDLSAYTEEELGQLSEVCGTFYEIV